MTTTALTTRGNLVMLPGAGPLGRGPPPSPLAVAQALVVASGPVPHGALGRGAAKAAGAA